MAVAALNVLAQPVWLSLAWVGVRKLFLGLTGRIGYAWAEVWPEELRDAPAAQLSAVRLLCVLQGLVILPLGLAGTFSCATPLLRAFFG